jgi:hypothetical protein
VSPLAGIVASLVYVSIPWVAQVSSHGRVEGVSAFYLLLAVYALLLRRPALSAPKNSGSVMLSGYLAGAAVACAYPATLMVVAPLFGWVWLRGRRANWKDAGVFLAAVLVACGGWFVKNWYLTGNPTYPLFYELFGGRTRTLENDAYWIGSHIAHTWTLAQLGNNLMAIVLNSEWISPLLVPLALLTLLVKSHRRLILTLWALVAYELACWWLFTDRIERFWLPLLPLLALLAGVGATWTSTTAWRRACFSWSRGQPLTIPISSPCRLYVRIQSVSIPGTRSYARWCRPAIGCC